MEIVQQEGTRQVKRVQAFYNLDAIISVSELLFNPIESVKFVVSRMFSLFLPRGLFHLLRREKSMLISGV